MHRQLSLPLNLRALVMRWMKHWPLIIALITLWTVLGYYTVAIVEHNGLFIYTIDDVYIHLAIAKQLVTVGHWSTNAFQDFAGASSSVLYPPLLAGFFAVFGNHAIIPFVLNTVLATALLITVYVCLNAYRIHPVLMLIALVATLYFGTIPSLVFGGMEHILHMLCTIPLFYFAGKVARSALREEKCSTLFHTYEHRMVILLALLATAARYESLFFIAPICVFFFFTHRRRLAVMTAIASAVPVFAYAAMSLAHGGYALPSTLVLKGTAPNTLEMAIDYLLHNLSLAQFMASLILLILMSLLYMQHREHRIRKDSQVMSAAFLTTLLLHTQFANIDWVFRHRTHLIVLGLFVITVNIRAIHATLQSIRLNARHLAVAGIMTVAIVTTLGPLAVRGNTALTQIVNSSANIYEQHYQIARFLQQYYEGEGVALLDVGTTSYFSNTDVVDLWGLATIEVARAITAEHYTAQTVDTIAKERNAHIAVMYSSTAATVPAHWIPVGSWKIANRVSAARDTVTFYALNAAHAEKLAQNLRNFSSQLPAGVSESGPYLNGTL